MRNISFALTTEQVRWRQKTVTRRIGWAFLKPGTLLQSIVKGQGIPKGCKVEKIGGPIRVVNVRVEKLDTLLNGIDVGATYGLREVVKEWFGAPPARLTVREFVAMFCASHIELDAFVSDAQARR